VGDFDCGCLTGRIMGLVDVDADEYPDLFMQNSKWYPGTFLYYFRKFNGDGTPVFSKGVELKMPDNAAFGGTILPIADQLVAYWPNGRGLSYALFDRDNLTFGAHKPVAIQGL